MAITHASQGTAVGTETSGATLNPTCPATVTAGQILVATIYMEGTSTAPADPGGGWVLLDSVDGPRVVQTTIGRMYLYGLIADGSEDGAAVDFGSPAVTTMRCARIYSFNGRVSGAVDKLVKGFSFLSHATDPQMPDVTTTQAGALGVAFIAQNDNNTMGDVTGESGGTWVEAVGESLFALTPGASLGFRTCTPTGDPGTVTGGSISTTNDPVGVLGFQILDAPEPQTVTLTPATESDAGQALSIFERVALVNATEADVGQALDYFIDGGGGFATPTLDANLGNNTDNTLLVTATVAALTRVNLWVYWFGTQTLNTVTDNGPGLTWEQVFEYRQGGSDHNIALFTAWNASEVTADFTITANFSATPSFGPGMAAESWLGLRETSHTEDTGAKVETFNEAWVTDSLDISIPCLLLGFSVGSSGASNTPNDTEVHDWTAEGATRGAVAYRVESEAGSSLEVRGTWASAVDFEMNGAVAFKAAATAGGWDGNLVPAAEADSGQTLNVDKKKSLVSGSESDSGQALDVDKKKSLAPGSESDSAINRTHFGRVTLAPGTEADSGQALDVDTKVTLSPSLESDAGQALDIDGGPGPLTLVPALESDTGQPLDVDEKVTLTPGLESDSGQALNVDKKKSLVPGSESDSATNRTFFTRVALVPASEVDSGTLLNVDQQITLVPASELDSALNRVFIQRVTLTPALEVDLPASLDISGPIRVTLIPALESDSALNRQYYTNVLLTHANEIDSALTRSLFTRIQLNSASEADQAQVLQIIHAIRRDLTPALETDVAVPILYAIITDRWVQTSELSWDSAFVLRWVQDPDANWPGP